MAKNHSPKKRARAQEAVTPGPIVGTNTSEIFKKEIDWRESEIRCMKSSLRECLEAIEGVGKLLAGSYEIVHAENYRMLGCTVGSALLEIVERAEDQLDEDDYSGKVKMAEKFVRGEALPPLWTDLTRISVLKVAREPSGAIRHLYLCGFERDHNV